jgi:hypothetical protein
MIKGIISILIFLLLICPLYSADREVSLDELPTFEGAYVRMYTESGTSFQGKLLTVSEDRIELLDKDGQIITISSTFITKVVIKEEGARKKSYFRDAANSRLLLMPTAFPMEQGEFHIADQELGLVTTSYGLSPNVSFWAGISFPGMLANVRVSLPIGDKAAFSIGSFAGLIWFDFAGVLLPFSIFSFGTPEQNFTIGGGAMFFYTIDNFYLSYAMLFLGGKKVLSDTSALVSENWIIVGERYTNDNTIREWDYVPLALFPSLAFRIAGENFSWDIGAIVPIMIDKYDDTGYEIYGIGGSWTFIPLPWVSVTYRID